MATPRKLIGRWRIVEMGEWDELDDLGPPYIEFDRKGQGSFRFMVIEGWMDVRPAEHLGPTGVEFCWEGQQEMDDASGRGWAPGGEGIERDVLLLEDVTVSLITERRDTPPWGLDGGDPGASGENWLLPGGDESRAELLPAKCTLQLKAGDVLRMRTPGGGGWGVPPG